MNWKIFGIATVGILCVVGMGATGWVAYKILQTLWYPQGGRVLAMERVRCNSQDPAVSVGGCTAILNAKEAEPADKTYARFQRGKSYERLGDFDHAIEDDTAVIQANPKEAMAYNNRGLAYQRKGDLDHAMTDYDHAIQLVPELSMAWFNRGEAHQLQANYAGAIEDFSRVIKLQPKNAVAWNNRCYYRAIEGQLDAALADCNQSLLLKPGVGYVLDSRGFTYLKMKKYELAIKDYDQAIAQEDHSAAYLYGRGLARRGMRDAAGSNADVAAALKIDPKIAEQFKKYGVS
jgi:tetratricopeptide (TPR) repeat protein